ncbi:hypothetical protein [Tamaricihabitans halophyticus]|nr:hypothetical protein [Tamaricihabitans halophyticus]
MRAGADNDALDRLITPHSASPGLAEAREIMLLLFGECSGMVSALGSGGTTPVKMQVYDDDGQEVPIDQADPPVRTAVRTLLAQVHGDAESARDQIEIALTSAEAEEVASLMLQALRWTMRLGLECLERDLPVSPWISESLTDAPD